MKPEKEKFLEVLSQYQGILYKVSLVYFKNKAMENNELQKIWITVDSGINKRSSEELNLLLTSKARQVFNEFLILNITAIPICVGVIIWLIH
ncbi:MAG: hypothetical protein K9G70_00005 [Prolixibacteraceae bacterium]|nr:hypothetical protein [Prolixibacteraceae bacterium]